MAQVRRICITVTMVASEVVLMTICNLTSKVLLGSPVLGNRRLILGLSSLHKAAMVHHIKDYFSLRTHRPYLQPNIITIDYQINRHHISFSASLHRLLNIRVRPVWSGKMACHHQLPDREGRNSNSPRKTISCL